MLADPALLALLVSTAASSAVVLGAAGVGLSIAARWRPGSGSEGQYRLERLAPLASLLVSFALGVEILSLFFLVAVAERLHPLFPGAMCAAGVFAAAPGGYLALGLQVASSLAGGAWLVLDRLDARGEDSPLLRLKYLVLPPIALLVVAAAVALFRWALFLSPDVVTSCCGTIFDRARPEGALLPSLPAAPFALAFFGSGALALAAGVRLIRGGRGALSFSLACTLFSAVAAAALPSFVLPALYQLPGHRCPFCALQEAYGFVGYPLYAALYAAAVGGWGAGIADLFRRRPSLREGAPILRRKLALAAMAGVGLLALGGAGALILAWRRGVALF